MLSVAWTVFTFPVFAGLWLVAEANEAEALLVHLLQAQQALQLLLTHPQHEEL